MIHLSQERYGPSVPLDAPSSLNSWRCCSRPDMVVLVFVTFYNIPYRCRARQMDLLRILCTAIVQSRNLFSDRRWRECYRVRALCVHCRLRAPFSGSLLRLVGVFQSIWCAIEIAAESLSLIRTATRLFCTRLLNYQLIGSFSFTTCSENVTYV